MKCFNSFFSLLNFFSCFYLFQISSSNFFYITITNVHEIIWLGFSFVLLMSKQTSQNKTKTTSNDQWIRFWWMICRSVGKKLKVCVCVCRHQDSHLCFYRFYFDGGGIDETSQKTIIDDDDGNYHFHVFFSNTVAFFHQQSNQMKIMW